MRPPAQEFYFDRFDHGDVDPAPDFWAGPIRNGFCLAAEEGGGLALGRDTSVRSRSVADVPLFNEYVIHARLRVRQPQAGTLEFMLRTDGREGYLVALDWRRGALLLHRQGGGGKALLPPVSFPPAEVLHVRIVLKGRGPVVIGVQVSGSPDFSEPLVLVEHEEENWICHGEFVQLRVDSAADEPAAALDYFSIGTHAWEHSLAAWERTGRTGSRAGGPGLSIGALLSHEVTSSGTVVLHAEGGRVLLVPRLDGVVKVSFHPSGVAEGRRDSWSVTRTEWKASLPRVVPGDPLRIEGDGWIIDVEPNPVRLVFRDAEGALRLEESPGFPLQARGGSRRLAFALHEGESLHGMGQHALRPASVGMDLRGHTYRVENRHGPTGVIVLPFWISSRRCGVFVDNPGIATIDAGETAGDALVYESRAGALDYYVLIADSMAGVIDRYTQVTGRPALAPRWTLGNLQSRFGYDSFAMLHEIIDGFESRGIPLDAVILDLDWFGLRTMGDLDFQPTPDWAEPVESMRRIHARGIKVIPITEPQVTGLSRSAGEVLARGLVAREADERMAYNARVWWLTDQAPSYILDFTRPETRAWWGTKHERLIVDYGFDGFWQDLNEPEGVRPGMRFAAGTAPEVQNVIPLQMNRALAEAMEEHRPDARPFIMSRSGFAGMQKYGAGVWSGDVASKWFDLSRQPMIALHMGMSGVPYWNSDVGGYGGQTTPELYLRWCQFAFFNPIYRPHAAHMAREPWVFGEEVEAAVRELLLLRYRLLPYFYTTARMAYDTGMPMMRPLVLEWPDDPEVRNLADQFLYGPSLLAAPVLVEGATTRRVYLPAGTWYDWFTGERLEGGRWVVRDTPLARFPLFVHGPAIIPMGPAILRTDERPLDEVTLRVYLPPGTTRAEGELYEDDGLTLGYQRGAFSRTRFVTDDNGWVHIDAAVGSWDGMPTRRRWMAEYHGLEWTPARRAQIGGGWRRIDEAFTIPLRKGGPGRR